MEKVSKLGLLAPRPQTIEIDIGLQSYYEPISRIDNPFFRICAKDAKTQKQVGFLYFGANHEKANISCVSLHLNDSSYKGYGLGETLYQYLFKRTPGHSINVTIEEDNHVSKQLHKKLGFLKMEESCRYRKEGDKNQTPLPIIPGIFDTQRFVLKKKLSLQRNVKLFKERIEERILEKRLGIR